MQGISGGTERERAGNVLHWAAARRPANRVPNATGCQEAAPAEPGASREEGEEGGTGGAQHPGELRRLPVDEKGLGQDQRGLVRVCLVQRPHHQPPQFRLLLRGAASGCCYSALTGEQAALAPCDAVLARRVCQPGACMSAGEQYTRLVPGRAHAQGPWTRAAEAEVGRSQAGHPKEEPHAFALKGTGTGTKSQSCDSAAL